MKIYKISQDVNNDYGTYDSAVVYAKDEEEAKSIHPNGKDLIIYDGLLGWVSLDIKTEFFIGYKHGCNNEAFYSWVELKNVKVEYLGENPNITEKGVILASFNAG